MRTLKVKTAVLASVASVVFAAPVMAYTTGDFIVRGGSATVAPDKKSDTLYLVNATPNDDDGEAQASANNDTQLGLSFTYMITNKLGLEVLASTPFKHQIKGKGAMAGRDIGTIKQLPPTVSLQYYPMGQNSQWQPYIGAGINYTAFSSEEVDKGLKAAGYNSLSLEDSWGWAAQAGVDYLINKNWGVNASVMYIDINTTATLKDKEGNAPTTKGDYDLDPMVYRLSAVYRF